MVFVFVLCVDLATVTKKFLLNILIYIILYSRQESFIMAIWRQFVRKKTHTHKHTYKHSWRTDFYQK